MASFYIRRTALEAMSKASVILMGNGTGVM